MMSSRFLIFSVGAFCSFSVWALMFPAEPYPERAPAVDESTMIGDDIAGKKTLEEIPWTAPSYAGQELALGYAGYNFKVPPGLEERVQFWINIYTKHSSRGGVLHDSRYVHLVYGDLDFSDLWNQEMPPILREKVIDLRIKQAKEKIEQRLKRLQAVESTFGFDEEDLKLWEMFKTVDEPQKFLEAARRGRLRFQAGQSDIFKNGIRQSGRYIRQMEQIFKEEGLPMELTRLPFVESSFNLKARSRVGASGIWQFMRFTAKSYMHMDPSVDERNDPLTATRAAARKLRQNYQMLEDWPLAVTGYNHGPYGILRLSKKLNSKNIIDFVDFRKGSFGFASASFYASFLAALEVERRAAEFFGPLNIEPPLVGSEYKLKKALPVIQLLEFYEGDEERARAMNPHILSQIWQQKGAILSKNMIRLDQSAKTKAEGWSKLDQFMFSTRAM